METGAYSTTKPIVRCTLNISDYIHIHEVLFFDCFRHKELATQKYIQLDDKLRKDPRLQDIF